mmetsp:Transcript_85355/g.242046  ORF Transcript_85355/g.242046 Transcript_85355/m.242046 type:complete len:393 (+) Transcript_85355:225-1403(+)
MPMEATTSVAAGARRMPSSRSPAGPRASRRCPCGAAAPASGRTIKGTPARTSPAPGPWAASADSMAGLSLGSAIPIRSRSKSRAITNCSRKAPPRTQSSSRASSSCDPLDVTGTCCRRRRLSALGCPPACEPIRRFTSGSSTGSRIVPVRPRSPQWVELPLSLPASHTSVWVQIVPFGRVFTTSSICSPPPGCAARNGRPLVALGRSIGSGKGNGGTGEPPAGKAWPMLGPWLPPTPPLPRMSPRSSNGSREAIGFGWIWRRHRSPPSSVRVLLKSCGILSANSRPPKYTRSCPGAMSAEGCVTAQSQTTRLPALGSCPHKSSNTVPGRRARTMPVKCFRGASRKDVPVSSTKRVLAGMRPWMATPPVAAQKERSPPRPSASAGTQTSEPGL